MEVWHELHPLRTAIPYLTPDEVFSLCAAINARHAEARGGERPSCLTATVWDLLQKVVQCLKRNEGELDNVQEQVKPVHLLISTCFKLKLLSEKQCTSLYNGLDLAGSPKGAEAIVWPSLQPQPCECMPIPEVVSPPLSYFFTRAWMDARIGASDEDRRKNALSSLQALCDRIIRGSGLIPPQIAPTVRRQDLAIHMFGSSANGLGAVDSDVDAVLVCSPALDRYLHPPERPDATFKVLQKKLVWQGVGGREWGRWTAIARARIPILRGCHLPTGVEFDLSLFQSLPLANSALIRAYTTLHHTIQPFLVAWKQWAKGVGISAAADGTLSAYAWAVAGLFFLQRAGFIPSLQSSLIAALVQVAPQGEAWRVVHRAMAQGWPVEYVPPGLVHDLINKHAVLQERYAWGACGVCEDALEMRQQMPSKAQQVGPHHLLWGCIQYWARPATRAQGAASIRTGTWLPRDTFCSPSPSPDYLATLPPEQAVWEAPPPSPAWRISIEDPFELSHDLGRVVRPYGQVCIEEELCRACDVWQGVVRQAVQAHREQEQVQGQQGGQGRGPWQKPAAHMSASERVILAEMPSLFTPVHDRTREVREKQASFVARVEAYEASAPPRRKDMQWKAAVDSVRKEARDVLDHSKLQFPHEQLHALWAWMDRQRDSEGKQEGKQKVEEGAANDVAAALQTLSLSS